MVDGILEADGSTSSIVVNNSNGMHIALRGDFGGGSITVEQEVRGVFYPSKSPDDLDITYSSPVDRIINFRLGDKFRLTLSGSTSPSVKWSVSGGSSAA